MKGTNRDYLKKGRFLNMNGSRRFYERVNVEKEAIVYINNKEFDVEIKDIAEEGISFTVNNDNPVLANINISDILKFTAIDIYTYFDTVRTDVIIGRCKIIRIDDSLVDSSKKIVGCKFVNASQDLLDYVSAKKVMEFIKSLKGD